MRRRRRAFQLSVEPLEIRVLPAAVTVSKGAMTIKNQVGELTVETTDVANQIRVTDDTGSFLYDGVKSKITIVGTNGHDIINVRSDCDTEMFGGTLTIQSGKGNDTLSLSGLFGGNVVLQGGAGDDVVTSADDVLVGGNLTITDTTGFNQVLIDDHVWFVANSMTATGVSTFAVTGEVGSLNVWGSLTITAPGSTGSQLTGFFAGDSLNVGGNLKITGGNGMDTLSISSELHVGGSMTVNLRSGDNVFALAPGGGDSGIVGTLSYTGSAGTDMVTTGTLFIGGNATFNTGNGINQVTVSDTTRFYGSVAINGGSSQNITMFAGTVDGNLAVKYAGGMNNMTLAGGNVANTFIYRSGASTMDSVIVHFEQQLANVDIQYGAGQHLLHLQTPYTGKITGSKGAVIRSSLI